MKEVILKEVETLAAKFVYYDRKEDEDLSMYDLDKAIRSGEITIDEIVNKFKETLISNYQEKP